MSSLNPVSKMRALNICTPDCYLGDVPPSVLRWTGSPDKIKCIACKGTELISNDDSSCKEMSSICYNNFMDFLEKFEKYGIRMIDIIIINPVFGNQDNFYTTNHTIEDIEEKEAIALSVYVFDNEFTIEDIIAFVTGYIDVVTFEDIIIEKTEHYYYNVNRLPNYFARMVFVYDLIDREVYIFRDRIYRFFQAIQV